MDAVEIMDRLKLVRQPDALAAVQEWLGPLDHYDALAKLDFAYMELRMSCWGFADSYALPNQLELHPLISRRIYRAMLSLPADVRRNNGMTMLCIEWEWPEAYRKSARRNAKGTPAGLSWVSEGAGSPAPDLIQPDGLRTACCRICVRSQAGSNSPSPFGYPVRTHAAQIHHGRSAWRKQNVLRLEDRLGS
jgi:hypothetical protein